MNVRNMRWYWAKHINCIKYVRMTSRVITWRPHTTRKHGKMEIRHGHILEQHMAEDCARYAITAWVAAC